MTHDPGDTSMRLLNSHRLGKIPREVNVETLRDRKPVGHELQGNDIQQTLQDVGSVWDLDTLGLGCREFTLASVTDDDGSTRTSNN